MASVNDDNLLQETQVTDTTCDAETSSDFLSANRTANLGKEGLNYPDLQDEACSIGEYEEHVAEFTQRMSAAAMVLSIALTLFVLRSMTYAAGLFPASCLLAVSGLVLAIHGVLDHDIFVLSTPWVDGSRSDRELLRAQSTLVQRVSVALALVIVSYFLRIALLELQRPVAAAVVPCVCASCSIVIMVQAVVTSLLYDPEAFNERQVRRLSAANEETLDDADECDEADDKLDPYRTKAARVMRSFAIAAASMMLLCASGDFLRHSFSFYVTGSLLYRCCWLPLLYPCAVLVFG